jgi:hypothetical protein
MHIFQCRAVASNKTNFLLKISMVHRMILLASGYGAGRVAVAVPTSTLFGKA